MSQEMQYQQKLFEVQPRDNKSHVKNTDKSFIQEPRECSFTKKEEIKPLQKNPTKYYLQAAAHAK